MAHTVLYDRKNTHYGSIHKSEFPALLRETIEDCETQNHENINAGFGGSGIIPFHLRHSTYKNI